jgi:hypothetical protein
LAYIGTARRQRLFFHTVGIVFSLVRAFFSGFPKRYPQAVHNPVHSLSGDCPQVLQRFIHRATWPGAVPPHIVGWRTAVMTLLGIGRVPAHRVDGGDR